MRVFGDYLNCTGASSSRLQAIRALTVLIALGVFCGCDSKSRGESQNAASNDSIISTNNEPVDSVEKDIVDDTKPIADDENTSAQSPAAEDLKRYTNDLPEHGTLYAVLETTLGDINCQLYDTETPITVANFVGLARGLKAWVDPDSGESRSGEPFYDGVIFHRVIPGFMIQAGDKTGTGMHGPGYTIPDEFTPEHRHDGAGVLSMANRGANTGGSQFFITEAATPHLDDRHTVFGHCENLDIVAAIARVPADAQDRPHQPPSIKQIRIEKR